MSPLPGGHADKFGNRYEGRWTVQQLLYVLLGKVNSVTVEQVEPAGEGVEFTLRRSGRVEAHQVKRQVGTANEWAIPTLNANGVLRAAKLHVDVGREFHFVSMVPARVLGELSERADTSNDPRQFIERLLTARDLNTGFNYLKEADVFGSADDVWRTLRGIRVRCVDERSLRDSNNALAGMLLDGAEPQLATAGLGDLINDHLNTELDANTLEQLLAEYGLRRAQLLGSPTHAATVRSCTDRWNGTVTPALLQPVIQRDESSEIWEQLHGDIRVLFVIGSAGGGKSVVAYEVVQQAEAFGWPTLALRLDRLEPITTPLALGRQLDLGVSPVSALGAIGRGVPSLLVIDQLDAVSLAATALNIWSIR